MTICCWKPRICVIYPLLSQFFCCNLRTFSANFWRQKKQTPPIYPLLECMAFICPCTTLQLFFFIVFSDNTTQFSYRYSLAKHFATFASKRQRKRTWIISNSAHAWLFPFGVIYFSGAVICPMAKTSLSCVWPLQWWWLSNGTNWHGNFYFPW